MSLGLRPRNGETLSLMLSLRDAPACLPVRLFLLVSRRNSIPYYCRSVSLYAFAAVPTISLFGFEHPYHLGPPSSARLCYCEALKTMVPRQARLHEEKWGAGFRRQTDAEFESPR